MKKTLFAAAAAVLLLAQLTACGETASQGKEENGTDAKTGTVTETEAVTEPAHEYPYPAAGFGGEEFNILNINDIWSMHSLIIRGTEETGEVLDDAILKRNHYVEDKLGVKLVETGIEETWEFKLVTAKGRASVLSGADEYQVMYIPLSASASMISEGMFLNLRDIDTLQLDQPWWYSTFNDPITINGALYGAMGGAHIMVQDGIRVLAFNYELMQNLDLDKPYDLVREGKWTLDRFNEYITAGANLNGDTTPAWDVNGNCVYGYSHNRRSMENFIHGCGEFIVENKNGTLVYSNGSDRFFNVIGKLSDIFVESDARVYSDMTGATDMDANGGSYLYAFHAGRALFGQAEICKFQMFRDLTFDFGVVPFPKYDEAQEPYYSNSYPSSAAAFIPVTSRDPSHVGVILDALAYEGERIVLPAFRELSVEQKGLRNDDSIEMLQLISDSLVPMYSVIYDIGTSFLDSVSEEVWAKKGNAASLVSANESAIKTQIEKVLTAWEGAE